MTNCPKFVEMQKMFNGKFVTIVEVQLVVKTQIIITNVNLVDVNIITRSKHTNLDQKPIHMHGGMEHNLVIISFLYMHVNLMK
jgi:hypothetical protein